MTSLCTIALPALCSCAPPPHQPYATSPLCATAPPTLCIVSLAHCRPTGPACHCPVALERCHLADLACRRPVALARCHPYALRAATSREKREGRSVSYREEKGRELTCREEKGNKEFTGGVQVTEATLRSDLKTKMHWIEISDPGEVIGDAAT
jgi:hypothetical protein